jgi:WD domain, G-beta repeat
MQRYMRSLLQKIEAGEIDPLSGKSTCAPGTDIVRRVGHLDAARDDGCLQDRPRQKGWLHQGRAFAVINRLAPGRGPAPHRGGRFQLPPATTADVVAVLRGHTGYVLSVDFGPDGKWLASSSGYRGKGEVKVWDSMQWHKKSDAK